MLQGGMQTFPATSKSNLTVTMNAEHDMAYAGTQIAGGVANWADVKGPPCGVNRDFGTESTSDDWDCT